MLRRMTLVIPAAGAALLAATLAPGCDYDPQAVESPAAVIAALSPEDLPVVAEVVVEERDTTALTEVNAQRAPESPSKSAPAAVQTYPLERHLFIAAAAVMRGVPEPCPPPNRVTVTVSDALGALTRVTLTVFDRPVYARVSVPCSSPRCDAPLFLAVDRESGERPLALTAYEAP